MRLVGATTVRDAADIIEAFVRHNLTVLDGLAIVDHGSSDGTSEILAALAAERCRVFVARDETPAFDQRALMNRLVRHVFATSDADWIFPIDTDEFIKVGSRQQLEEVLTRVSPPGHLVLPWLTYVPRFDVGDDALTTLRSARRVAQQRHGFAKVAVGRHFLAASNERIGKGSHTIERPNGPNNGNQHAACAADEAALAHVPIRSAAQFISKFATGWLGTLASGTRQGNESFHWRDGYAHLRAGRPLTAAQLTAFAMNYGVPQDRWLAVNEVELVEDPFLAEMELRHSAHCRTSDPLTLVLTVAEHLLTKAPCAP
jgi:hypothetical protein